MPMKRLKSGKWSRRLYLEPGRYEFKFLVDGLWCCFPGCKGDYTCEHCVYNEHGTMNRVLEVQ